ncbi:Protein EFR3 B [Glycine soja]
MWEHVCLLPALRSRSRQPVKRYRKLLADIFPKSPDESPSERKITKLCEYAAKNPFRIPKIAKYLEERCYKELRYEHIKLVNIIAESFNKLLSICKVQIAYFAVDVLNVILELLSYSKDETIQTLGCQCLSKFIYCQMDATYTHNIEKLVPKVCMLSREHGEACEKRCLRASSLQCLSAMVWFMAEFSHIFVDFDEVATSLAMQIRSESGLAEIGFVGVLCRHLRKSLQASSEFVGEQELNLNISLQNSIDDCLLEIANGVIDAQPLFDLMAINLENIPSGVVGRATIGSLIILARAVTLALSHLHSQQGFPEALLVQLLKVMLHSDVEARVGAHLIFSILLFPSSFHTNEISSLRSRYLSQHNKRHSHAPSVSASASITALLEKLRRNRNTKAENHVNIVHDQERDIVAEDWKQGCGLKNSPNFYKLTSIIDKATGSPSLTDTEPYVMKLTEDQMAQLLSAFWIQAEIGSCEIGSNILC